jgi:hypothetical protein
MILFDPGNLDEFKVCNMVKSCSSEIMLITQIHKSYIKYKEHNLDCVLYSQISREGFSQEFNTNHLEIYKLILSDINTLHIYDRRFLPRSFMQNTHNIISLINYSVHFLSIMSVRRYIHLSAPHSPQSWILGRCFEYLTGNKSEYFNLSFLTWRVSRLKGLTERELTRLTPKAKYHLSEKLWGKYLNSKKSTGLAAMPAYERNNIKKSGLSALLYLVKLNIKRPDIVINTILCRRRYSKACTKLLPKKYVVMFLHYQPERTTVPDGDIFASQIVAALMIINSLPDDHVLVIKEHPSTFNRGTDWKHRWPSYYDDFKKIGAFFVDVRRDTYEIIDNSLCVVAVGGTVVPDAIMREKPAVYFGVGAVYPIEGAVLHRFTSIECLKDFFLSCTTFESENFKEIQGKLRIFIEEYTVSAPLKGSENFDDLTTLGYRHPAILRYIQHMFNE